MTEVQRLVAEEYKRDGYGRNSAISNGIIAVCAHARGTDNKGAVDLYHNLATGNWVKFRTITASDGQAEDQFGTSVSLDGDTLVVGALGDDDAAELAGAHYVFDRNFGGENNWGEVAKFTPLGAQIRDGLGSNVSVEGSTVVSGTNRPNATDGVPGFVEVFQLTEEPVLEPTDAEIAAIADAVFNFVNNMIGWKLTGTSSKATEARDAHLTQAKKKVWNLSKDLLIALKKK